ncbi:MAG: M56 family metallopeptidase [Sphingosinicella sp.]|nr:M56 family metallopeptidase [Sphingosinicella sp.]
MNERSLIEFLAFDPMVVAGSMLVLPAAAALISDLAARSLPPTKADWRVAAALAGFPGLVMLILCITNIVRASAHLHGGSFGHIVQYQGLPSLAFAILGYGILRARRRHRDTMSLMATSSPAGPALKAAAAELGVQVAEIPTDGYECFVAGFWRPTIFVSSGTIGKLSDAELYAALCHEQAHAAGYDPAFLFVLSFLKDIGPSSDRALNAYRQARERFADSEAVRRTSPIDVASALLAVARQSRRPAHTFMMASSCGNVWRLQAILGQEKSVPAMRSYPVLVATGLLLESGLSSLPALQVYLAYAVACGCAVSSAA